MTKETATGTDHQQLLRMTVDIVASFVTNNSIASESLPDLIRNVRATIYEISGGTADLEIKKTPAVPVSKSVTDDFIICLETGKKLKTLKRYLRSQFNMSPEDYRRKWNLPADYPMVAPNYSKRRSQFAKQIGLGKGGKAAAKKKS